MNRFGEYRAEACYTLVMGAICIMVHPVMARGMPFHEDGDSSMMCTGRCHLEREQDNRREGGEGGHGKSVAKYSSFETNVPN